MGNASGELAMGTGRRLQGLLDEICWQLGRRMDAFPLTGFIDMETEWKDLAVAAFSIALHSIDPVP
jgi:hypothetical protein